MSAIDLLTAATKRDSEQRLALKSHLVRLLYARGWEREKVRKLFRFIDWLMKLPSDLTIKFSTDIESLQKENTMPYVSTFQQVSRAEGMQDGIIKAVEARFGTEQLPEVAALVRNVWNDDDLNRTMRIAVRAGSVDEIISAIQAASVPE